MLCKVKMRNALQVLPEKDPSNQGIVHAATTDRNRARNKALFLAVLPDYWVQMSLTLVIIIRFILW